MDEAVDKKDGNGRGGRLTNMCEHVNIYIQLCKDRVHMKDQVAVELI